MKIETFDQRENSAKNIFAHDQSSTFRASNLRVFTLAPEKRKVSKAVETESSMIDVFPFASRGVETRYSHYLQS